MDVQVVGASGLLGEAVVRAVKRAGLRPIAPRLDVAHLPANPIEAPVVVNCAAILSRGKGPNLLEEVNSKGPLRLADACNAVNARLVHVSTDAVFAREGPHTEDSRPDPQDSYAYSKLRGEVVVAPHLTVRASFVGLGHSGVIADVLREIMGLRASDRLLCTSHTVDTVAELLVLLAQRSDITGLLHIPGEALSRWQLTTLIAQRTGSGVNIVRDDSMVADRRLSSVRWGTLGLPLLPPFADQLDRLLSERTLQEYRVLLGCSQV